ncbi:MAG TPA: class I SAM-dependent methyltransferase [Candidatus Nitrosotenuis sp.]|jgi:SAM-dependent methyltransferase|nr:class I SAM-dependent methyltransferase [Candidatus Nitrosotenuis sp.]
MKAPVYHRQTCRLCNSPRTELVVELAPIPLAEKYVTADQLEEPTELFPVDLYMCLDCGHVQLLDVIDPEILWKDYTYHSGQTQGIVAHFQQVAQEIVGRYRPPPGSLVVDVGSNDGTLLRAFQAHGLRVLGVDPAEEIALQATRSGIETLPHLLTPELARQIREAHGPASVVTAFNVFAHADDMGALADSIRHLLADDGIFVFEAQYLLDIIDHTLVGTIFHEHLCHHSVKPLLGFLRRHGMEMIDVRRVTIQHGSIIGTVQRLGGPHPVLRSVPELVALEEERELDRPQTLRAFARKLQGLRQRAAGLVAEWRSQGKTIAGYGAARSGPTLINQLGLEGAISYIFDDHPQKVHRYTPGHHIPVVPTAELYVRRPDVVVILAWIHARKILAAHQDYLEQGGRFMILCPEVEVVGPGQALEVVR